MNIGPLLHNFISAPEANLNTPAAKPQGNSFSSVLENSIGQVDQLLKVADEKNVELVAGKSENLHEAMIAFEKAESAFKLLVQVRNKAMEAYNEVMRMQV